MTKLTFALARIPNREQMPVICARCGKASTGFRRVKLKISKRFTGPELIPTIAGVSFEEQRRWHDFQQLFVKGKGVIELPVCWWHRWIIPPLIGIKSLTDSHFTLWGLNEKFAADLQRRGWASR